MYLPAPSDTETVRVDKTARLRADVSATDSSNAAFVRTLVVNETGSLSGIVTDNENRPLASTTVYAETSVAEGERFTLSPAEADLLETADGPLAVLNATWVVAVGGTGQSFEVKGYNLTEEAIDRRFSVESRLGVEASNGLREV